MHNAVIMLLCPIERFRNEDSQERASLGIHITHFDHSLLWLICKRMPVASSGRSFCGA